MKIQDVLFVPTQGAYFFDDQKAICAGAEQDGFSYKGKSVSKGFSQIRMPAEVISIMLVLDDGQVVVGDCCSVQYPSVGGREPPLNYDRLSPLLNYDIKPKLLNTEFDSFREIVEEFEQKGPLERNYPAAIRYGLSQALLHATAIGRKTTMAHVLAQDYDLKHGFEPIKIFAQSGEHVETAVDRMILRGIEVLPHGLVNDPIKKVGPGGKYFKQLVRWVRDRILKLRLDENYMPELHFDTYGTIGTVFGNDPEKVAAFLCDIEKEAAPFQLRIEHPVDAGNQMGQINLLSEIKERIQDLGGTVQIVADEWCETLEDFEKFAEAQAVDMLHIKVPDLGSIHDSIKAVDICKQTGILAYFGGSCTETDISARVSANLALATNPHQILAKPGMGVDEGHCIIANEMARSIILYDKKYNVFPP